MELLQSQPPGIAIFFIRGLKTVSQVLKNCKPDNLKAIRFMRKHGQKFLYGFWHKILIHLEYSLIKLFALSLLLSGSFLKTISRFVC